MRNKISVEDERETAIKMAITEQHLSHMSAEKLYATGLKKEKNSLTLYAADETTDPSSSTQ